MGRNKKSNSNLKQLVIDECPEYKHPGKCIWGYPCKHFLEKDEECKIFDKYVPYYKEMYAKEEARKRR